MILSEEMARLLAADLDFILPRTRCDRILLSKSRVVRQFEADPDSILDLVAGMDDADARWLSVPMDVLRPLIQRRQQGTTAQAEGDMPDLFGAD
jgi:hypothetical protein